MFNLHRWAFERYGKRSVRRVLVGKTNLSLEEGAKLRDRFNKDEIGNGGIFHYYRWSLEGV